MFNIVQRKTILINSFANYNKRLASIAVDKLLNLKRFHLVLKPSYSFDISAKISGRINFEIHGKFYKISSVFERKVLLFFLSFVGRYFD